MRISRTLCLAGFLLVLLPSLQGRGAQQIPTPEEHFGFVFGTERNSRVGMVFLITSL
ncbi:MAG: hypothetical protein CM1200mP14_26700 [Gammaproteobacteria bacterium]|nr:MAG: hypothetical protein CM1200mP14_26700 [Gammaproteobacteria bacterium]